jgi:3-hydroxymyristoyl/3-hydroxydecanoyl-(acyl carrier protein) dehydratase
MNNDCNHIFYVNIQKNHPACEGHFIGNPILPGVVTLEHVRLTFKKIYPTLQIKRFNKVKFIHSLKPEETLVINISLIDEKSGSFLCLNSNESRIATGTFDIEQSPMEYA